MREGDARLALSGAPATARPAGGRRARGRPDALSGILLMCAGVSMFPFLNTGVKLLAPHYPLAEIVWARFTGHLAIMLAVFLPRYGLRLFRTRRPAVQFGRSLLMLVSNMVFVAGIAFVPLATASAIGFTSPLIVTALSVPLLREKVGLRGWAAVIVGFLGALLIIRPGSGFANPAVLLLLASSACYALYQVLTRAIAAYDSAATGIVFAALMGSLATTIVQPFIFESPKNLSDLGLFVAIGFFGGAGHYLIIRAFQHGAAAVLAPLGYVELIGTATLGYLVFAQFPDLWTWMGAAVIIASGLYIALRERRRRGFPTPERSA